jgi:hypothetical protein
LWWKFALDDFGLRKAKIDKRSSNNSISEACSQNQNMIKIFSIVLINVVPHALVDVADRLFTGWVAIPCGTFHEVFNVAAFDDRVKFVRNR